MGKSHDTNNSLVHIPSCHAQNTWEVWQALGGTQRDMLEQRENPHLAKQTVRLMQSWRQPFPSIYEELNPTIDYGFSYPMLAALRKAGVRRYFELLAWSSEELVMIDDFEPALHAKVELWHTYRTARIFPETRAQWADLAFAGLHSVTPRHVRQKRLREIPYASEYVPQAEEDGRHMDLLLVQGPTVQNVIDSLLDREYKKGRGFRLLCACVMAHVFNRE